MALGLLVVACGPAPGPKTAAGPVLRVGTVVLPGSYYPDPVTGPFGLEHSLVEEFARTFDATVDWQVFDTEEALLAAVADRQLDFAAASLAITKARKARVRFGMVQRRVFVQAVYRVGSRRPRSLADLQDMEVVATSGASDDTDTGTTPAPVAFAQVEARQRDAALALHHQLVTLRRVLPNVRNGFATGERRELAWAFPLRGDQRLYRRAVFWVHSVKRSGHYDALVARHYSHHEVFDPAGALIWQRRLRTRLPKYQTLFEQAAERAGVDWRVLAAMSYQESHWNPLAVSPTGVRGLMMLTRTTAREVGIVDRRDPAESIEGGARYLERLLDRVDPGIRGEDRLWFALAAYNIGTGHVRDARFLTRLFGMDADSWLAVRRHLPLLEQPVWHGRTQFGYARGTEPVRYVEQIRRYYDALRWQPMRARLLSELEEAEAPGGTL